MEKIEPKILPEDRIKQVRFLLESLPFRKMYSLGDRIDLLLVYSGLKSATDITIGKDWEEGQRPLNLTEGEIDLARKKLESAGFAFVDLAKETGTIKGIDEGETKPSVKYHYEQSKFFIAKDKVVAETLKSADDENYGRLSGFPESAIGAYLKAEEDPTTIIEIENLPEEIRTQDFMAFATFKLSRKNWKEEIETVKKWADTIKKLDPTLYEEAVKTYKEIDRGSRVRPRRVSTAP